MKIWVVAFSDNEYCYVGQTALFEKEEEARKFFEQARKDMKIDYKEEVSYFEEDNDCCEGYADPYANDTVCSLAVFPREIDGKWVGNLDW